MLNNESYMSHDIIEKHNSKEDGWMILGNSVLDVTNFLDIHPGGMDYMLPYLGKDCTEVFMETMHSKAAVNLIEKYRIGYINVVQPSNLALEYKYLYKPPTFATNFDSSTSNLSANSTHSSSNTSTLSANSTTIDSAHLTHKIDNKASNFSNLSQTNHKEDTARLTQTTTQSTHTNSKQDTTSTHTNSKQDTTSTRTNSKQDTTSTRTNNQPTTTTTHTNDVSPHSLIDFNKPLLLEIARLNREEYFRLIDSPYTTNEVLQIFPIEPFEMLSKTHWFVIPLIYIPLICFIFYMGTQLYPTTHTIMTCTFFLGLFLWTLSEYLLHRFLFHYLEEFLPDHYLFICFHFLIHSVHHLLPMDPMRLVMPPALFAVFVLPFWLLSYVIFPTNILYYLWPGILFGYLCYDTIHYSTHHFSVAEYIPHLKNMKIYHMKHHYKFPLKGFGVSSKFWDRIFNTLIE